MTNPAILAPAMISACVCPKAFCLAPLVAEVLEGVAVGDLSMIGALEGFLEGTLKGSLEGTLEGSFEGTLEGSFEGTLEGSMEGSEVG